MKTGLVSISFRKKTPLELIKASKESGLEYIEWGGDVHIPMGNTSPHSLHTCDVSPP